METVVVSDMHLSDAEPPHPRRPGWKAYKRREYFFDDDFARLLEHVSQGAEGPVELVLNGDTFDFNNITRLPADPEGEVGWLARQRGLAAEEWMSAFKMGCIIADHPVWFSALRRFLERGHRAVFVIGNHDAELHWPRVQAQVRDALGVANDDRCVAFCSWFYLSGGDTYISHGNQYDPYCVVQNPIDPLIEVRRRPRVRIPFGDQAQRYMLNGMGYFNPHATSNFIMTAKQYAVFFFTRMLWTQPLLLWTWFWGAMATLFITLSEFMRPAMRDPLYVDEKTQDLASNANATPSMVRKLHALQVPSACTSPLMVLRELWLDRGLLVLGAILLAWQIVLMVNMVWPASPLWVFLPLAAMTPAVLIYSATVRSGVFQAPLLTEERAGLIHQITGVERVIFGHTHVPLLQHIGPVAYVNGGFWSAAFADPECTRRIGTQTFVWLRPDGTGRRVELLEWPPGGAEPLPYTAAEPNDAPERAPALTGRESKRRARSGPGTR